MIARLRGTLLEKKPPHLLLEVGTVDSGGIAYDIEATMHSFYQLPAIGEQVTLYTHFIVREDAQLLYGFIDEDERALFRSLIKVNGVGPRSAITLLSSIEVSQFIRCIADHDTASLIKLPGIGKKTAERLIVEMHDRLKDLPLSQRSAITAAGAGMETPSQVVDDAVSALIALGYKPADASRALSRIDIDNKSREQLIREALQGVVS